MAEGLISNGHVSNLLPNLYADQPASIGIIDATFFDSIASPSDSFGDFLGKDAAVNSQARDGFAEGPSYGRQAQSPLNNYGQNGKAAPQQPPPAMPSFEGPPFNPQSFQQFLDQQELLRPFTAPLNQPATDMEPRSSGSSGEMEAPVKLNRNSADKTSGESSGLDAKLLDQLSRMKDKNRKAQKRYREKQKSKLAETESRVEELTRQVSQLQMEKQTLASRNSLLEKYMAMKEEQSTAVTTTAAQRSSRALEDSWWLDGPTKRMIEQSLNLTGVMTFTVRENQVLRMTREQVATLTIDQWNQLWKEYINKMAQCLLEAKDDPNSPAAQRLAELVYEAGMLKVSVITNNPAKLRSMMAGANDAIGFNSEPPTRETWRQLGHAMNLTPVQMRYLVQLREMYLRSLSSLVIRRQDLSEVLQGAKPMTSQEWSQGRVLPTQQYMQTIEAVEELREILRKEHSLTLQFVVTCWRRVFTTFQGAQLNVQAYPWSANVMEIINLLAEEAGEPSADQLLAGNLPVRVGRMPLAAEPHEELPKNHFNLGFCGGPDPRTLPTASAEARFASSSDPSAASAAAVAGVDGGQDA